MMEGVSERISNLERDYNFVEKQLRMRLLANHGHTCLYLDDGEMQCSECINVGLGVVDFKRTPIRELVEHIETLSIRERLIILTRKRRNAMDHPNYNDHEKMLTDLKKLSMEHKFPVFLETCRQEIEKSDLIKSREMVDSFDRFDKCNYMLGISSVDPKEIPAKLKIFKNSLGKKVV